MLQEVWVLTYNESVITSLACFILEIVAVSLEVVLATGPTHGRDGG